MMKWKRIVSMMLVICLFGGTCPATARAGTEAGQVESEAQETGNLDVLLQMNFPVYQKEQDITITLNKDGLPFLENIALEQKEAEYEAKDGRKYQVAMSLAGLDGEPAIMGGELSMVSFSFRKIPQGTYLVKLSANGFKTYYSEEMEIKEYSKRLILANNNNTFTSGDLDEDGSVTQKDLELLKDQLWENKKIPDLNRDGKWDIVDYAYLFNNLDAVGEETVENTTLNPQSFVDLAAMEEPVQSLFNDANTEPVSFSSASGETISEQNPVEIEIPFKTAPEIQYITLTSGAGTSGVAKGVVYYETENGQPGEIPFGSSSENRSVFSLYSVTPGAEERKEITIDLGKRIVVKRITIKITGTQEDSKLASIGKVEFLQNLIPTLSQEANMVKNLTAKEGDKSVTLTWTGIANVTGYRIQYWTQPGGSIEELTVETCSAKIENLNNGTLYYFTVTPVNGDWVGITSAEIACTPIEAAPPGRVGNVQVEEGNTTLAITWGLSKNTDYYKLYYKEENSSGAYTVISPIKENKYTLTGLTNDISYLICVSAVNAFGEGSKSPEAIGTPYLLKVEEPEGLPTYNRIDNSSITNIRLTHKDHYDKNIYPDGFDPKTMIDGDYKTHWTSRAWWEDAGFVVTFDKAYEMNHMAWITRLDETRFKNTLNRYEIEVWKEGDDLDGKGTVLVPFGSYITKNPHSSDGLEILTFEKSEVKQIKVTAKMKDGGPALPSASELIFYSYYSLVDEIGKLFADDLHTKLNEEASKEKIEEFRNRVNGDSGEFYVDKAFLNQELELAESLLPGNTPLTNIVAVEAGRNAASDRNRNFSYTLCDLQPLGLTAKAGDTLLIYAQGDEKDLPSLIATQYAGEAGNYMSSPMPLKPGRNTVTIPKIGSGSKQRGGSLYLQYAGKKENVQINILGGLKMPILNLPSFTFEEEMQEDAIKSELEAYIQALESYTPQIPNNNTLQTAVENSTEIATKHVLLSIPAKPVATILAGYKSMEEKVHALYKAVAAWERNMEVHYTVCGLTADATESRNQYPSSRINIRYMTITGKAFMYAGGGHIGIMYGSSGATVKGRIPEMGETGLFSWGFNHEIGHVLDQGGLTYAETTNNIHSLFSQTYDGVNNTGPSRLEGGIWNKVYDKIAQGIPGKSNNVFVQLGMYWQLHLAYDEGGSDSFGFYQQLYRTLRDKKQDEAYQGLTSDMLFIRLACDTVKKDLTDFFEHWGMSPDQDTREYLAQKAYPAEERAIYYLNDSARRYRLDKKGKGFDTEAGNASLMVEAVQKDNSKKSVTIQMTLPANVSETDVLGYEIKRNGKTIAFTTDNVYEDCAFAGNNLELTYEAAAYDKLLQKITGAAIPFKIAYDGALDGKGFVYQVNGNTVTIDMENQQDIIGVKIKGAPDGPKTVSGSVVLKDKTVPVTLSLSGKADAGTSSLYYFTYPETGEDDGRIWTYGVQRFSVSMDCFAGLLPEEAADMISVLTYPGDDIAFYHPKDQNTVGILKEDYVYGPDSMDVIKKGTVIVVGTYRGDPVFNAIKLYGTYFEGPQEGKDDEIKTEPVLIQGEQLFFAEVPQDKVMTNISNGLWIYIPDAEAVKTLPATVKAELYRVDNEGTLEGERLVSNTEDIAVATYETLPYITLHADVLKAEETK